MNTNYHIANCFIPVRAVGFSLVPAAPRTPETLGLYYNHGVPSNEKDVMARIERMFIVEDAGDSTVSARHESVTEPCHAQQHNAYAEL